MNEQKSNLKNRILKSFYWLSSLTFIGQIIAWAVTIVVIRLLKPEDYGLMAMAMVFMSFLALLNEVGLGTAIIQKAEINDQEIKKIFGFILVVNIIFILIVYFSAPLVAGFFKTNQLIFILRLLSINFILTAIFVIPQSILMRELEFRKKSTIDLFGNLISSAIVLTMAWLSYGVLSLVMGMIGMNLFKAIAFNSAKKYRYTPAFSLKGVRKLLTFGGYISISRVLWYFYSQADIIIAGRLFGKELLGVYSVAMNLVSIPLNKLSPLFIQIGLPAFSLIQGDLKAIQSNFLKILRILNIFSFPGFIGLSLITPEAVSVILGPKWQGAILPMQLLAIAMPLRFISMIFPPVVTGRGHPEIITGNMVYAVIIMPIAFYIGSHWGIHGLCYAWITAFPILFAIMLKRTFNVLDLPIRTFFGTLWTPLIGSGIMAAGVLIIKLNPYMLFTPLLLLTVMIAVCIVLYCSTVFIVDRKVYAEIYSFFSKG